MEAVRRAIPYSLSGGGEGACAVTIVRTSTIYHACRDPERDFLEPETDSRQIHLLLTAPTTEYLQVIVWI